MATRRRQPSQPIDLGPRLDRLAERLRAEHDVLALFLYGSYGTPEQTPLSDVDLALVSRPSQTPAIERELEVRAAEPAATRWIQVAIEAVLDAANHIVAREGWVSPRPTEKRSIC
jgi:predicted nucleotidyltransferase